MIPNGTATKVAQIVKELGGITFPALWSLLQWEGLQKEDSTFVVGVLKRYRVIEERGGVLRYTGKE